MKYLSKKNIFLMVSVLGLLFLTSILRNNFLDDGQMVYTKNVSSDQAKTENFNQDLKKAGDHWVHTNRGWDYAKNGEYEKAIEEYKKAIEIIQSAPGDDWPNLKKEDADRINQEARNDSQIFPRHRLVQALEKTERYQEAFEQIDWLLAHHPLDHVKEELLAKKAQLQPPYRTPLDREGLENR